MASGGPPHPFWKPKKRIGIFHLVRRTISQPPSKKTKIYIYWACKAGWIRWPSFARSGLLERPLTKVITAATLSKNRGLDDCETGQAVRSGRAAPLKAQAAQCGSLLAAKGLEVHRNWLPQNWDGFGIRLVGKRWGGNHQIQDCQLRQQRLRLPKIDVAAGEKLKISFQFKAHNCFDHLEACFNLRCHSRYRLILSSFNGHGTTIAYSAVNALFQEVGDTVQLWGCATCGLPSCPGMEDDVLDLWWRRALAQNLTKPVLLMSTRSCVRPKNVPVFCMGCFLSAANG